MKKFIMFSFPVKGLPELHSKFNVIEVKESESFVDWWTYLQQFKVSVSQRSSCSPPVQAWIFQTLFSKLQKLPL